MAEVAVLGTGLMGAAMSRRLLAAGHAVTVWNRTRARAVPLAGQGARVAASPAEAADGAAFVLAALGDDDASRAVWTGAEGALAARAGTPGIAIEASTLSPAWVRELGDRARAAGWAFADCPVTGGPDGAVAGTLTVLAGADDAALLERARPVLDAIAHEVVHFGPVGAGSTYKLVVNLIASVQAAALAEGLLVAERAGLDVALVAETLARGSVASPLVRYLAPRLLGDDHDDVYFATRWREKDARYGCALAVAVGAPSATGEAAARVFGAAVDAGTGACNESAVYKVLVRLAGESRRGRAR